MSELYYCTLHYNYDLKSKEVVVTKNHVRCSRDAGAGQDMIVICDMFFGL